MGSALWVDPEKMLGKREESGLVIPNERRTPQYGIFSGSTARSY